MAPDRKQASWFSRHQFNSHPWWGLHPIPEMSVNFQREDIVAANIQYIHISAYTEIVHHLVQYVVEIAVGREFYSVRYI